jgi:hypothetical protein
MSDTTKLILAIVVVVVVVAVIISLFMNARKRRELEHRRFEAGELRAQIEEQAPRLQETEDRASVTGAIAADARTAADRTAAEAERKAAEARQLEEQAQQQAAEARRLEQHAEKHAEEAAQAQSSLVDLEREADRVDPDVRTDAEGHRLDESGQRLPAQESAGATAAAATAGGTAAAASAPFLRDDDEPDLADAENPFATNDARGDTETLDAGEATDASRASEVEDSPAPANEADTSADSAWDDGLVGTESVDHTPDENRDDVSNDDTTTRDETTTGSASAGTDTDQGPVEPAYDDHGLLVRDDAEETVSVPALEDRDQYVTETGTPDDDPGDHRGQPWATTSGTPAPETDRDPETGAEEGQATEGALGSRMDPSTQTEIDGGAGEPASPESTSHASSTEEPADESVTDEAWADEPVTEEPVAAGSGSDERPSDEPVGEESQAHETVTDEAWSDEPTSDEPTSDEQQQAGPRISSFEEVVDGGFGIGSAAPLADGAQPLGHAVKASRDGSTFLLPGDEGYDDAAPDVWFYNEESARRAGFRKPGE